MPGTRAGRFAASGLLLFAVALSSCSSSAQTPAATDSGAPSAALPPGQPAETHTVPPTTTGSPDKEPAVPVATAGSSATPKETAGNERPAPTDKPTASHPVKAPAESTVPSHEDGVEVSNAPIGGSGEQPQPSVQPSSAVFKADQPSLGGMELGSSIEGVSAKYGQPYDKYPLPGEEASIEIWDYEGFSIGLNDQEEVVYIEVTSTEFSTGIDGLSSGIDGSTAARTLGLSGEEDQLQVLSLEVSGGWLKVDLDPDTRKVISLKLLSREI